MLKMEGRICDRCSTLLSLTKCIWFRKTKKGKIQKFCSIECRDTHMGQHKRKKK